MNIQKKPLVALLFALAVLVPAWAGAHGGHIHKVLGTVASITGDHVEIKGTDGKMLTLMLDAKTAITRGKEKLDKTAIKIGERVSVDYMQDKDMLMARAVKLAQIRVSK